MHKQSCCTTGLFIFGIRLENVSRYVYALVESVVVVLYYTNADGVCVDVRRVVMRSEVEAC
jgi:hypothetical protein